MGIFNFLSSGFGKPVNAGRIFGRVLKPYAIKVVEERWEAVEQLVLGGKPSQLRQAVVEADKILDYSLSQLCSGNSLGERLKTAKDLYSDAVYSKLWDAHKIRNTLVHDVTFEMPTTSCRDAVNNIKAGLVAVGFRPAGGGFKGWHKK